ncbi:C2H2-type zinc finger protein [Streptomyces sp. NPDC053560]|uniref:C2H2-type zinc finger protein n=1 Tax=Streptomyces sp. NPDC053560 TaxID=3365711 RepID=UPI0037D4E257
MIHVEPARESRIALARWAVAQTPKVGTAGPNTFAVPADLFTHMPEALLIGARVDGHRYVSPDEDASASAGEGAAEAELTGVARPEGLVASTPGEATSDAPEGPDGPETTPPAAVDSGQETPALESGSAPDDDGEYRCDICGRPFASERGRTTHIRRAHPDGER